ncbi:MAG: EamA family transporter [Pseudomonadota bacterium]
MLLISVLTRGCQQGLNYKPAMAISIAHSNQWRQRRGVLLVAGSAVAWSLAAWFTRTIEADIWAVQFWRAVWAGLFILTYVHLRGVDGGLPGIARLGRPGWAVAIVGACATLCFLAAFRLTAAANVVLMYATAPFVAAGLAWLLMREAPGRSTLIASVFALAGAAVMVSGSLTSGNLTGDLLAVGMTLGMALMTVIIRRHRALPMVIAGAFSSWLIIPVAFPMTDVFAVSARDFWLLVLFGAVQAAGITLMTEGARLIPSAQVPLIGTLDIPLAALWVWLAFSEVPPELTILGGGLILAAVLWHLRRQSDP